MSSRSRLFALLLTAGGLLLAACAAPTQAPGGPAAASPVASPMAASDTQCIPGQEAWRSPDPPKRGGSLTRAHASLPNLDFTKPGATGTSPIAQVYNSLLRSRDCFAGDTVMVPGLAEAWEASSDGTVWTLKLRRDVKWHDLPPVNSRQFTSSDVAWTSEYQKREGVLRSYWENVTHEEPDSYSVVLRLAQPDADFIYKLGYYTNLMLPHEIKEQYGDFKTVAVGTGAFMVKDFRPNVISVLTPNPGYYEKGQDGKPLPYLEEVRTLPIGDYAAMVAATRTGQIDTNSFVGFRKLDLDALKQGNPKLRPWELLQGNHEGLWFNFSRPPFDDVRVRKAIALGIDRQRLIASNRGAVVQSGFVPLFFRDYAWPAETMAARFRADPDQARKLLAGTGFDFAGKEFELRTATPTAEDAEVVQSMLQAIGIRSKVTVPADTFSAVLARRDYDMAFGLPVGALFLDLWVGSYVQTGGSNNIMGFSDPEVDALAAAQSRELDPATRKALVDRVQDRLYETMPYVPMVSRIYYHFISCRVRNHSYVHPNYNPRSPVEAWTDQTGC